MWSVSVVALICIYFASFTKASPTNRVVGGDYAIDGQFPYQVSLRANGSHNCGGSIISRDFILTAAHCVGNDVSTLSVRMGSTDRFRGGEVIRAKEVIVHEKYGDFLNDVALIRLEEPIIYSDKIQPIPLASSEVFPGEKVVISGWGRVKHGGDIPRKLKFNELSVISRDECRERIQMGSESLLCLDHEANNGACNGDSGGPAMYNGEVVGIAGFVYGGCGTANPDGYAKVFHHRDWIIQHANLK